MPLTEAHFKFLWAAYRKGDFADAAMPPPSGLDPVGFRDWATTSALRVIDSGGDIVVALARGTPVGLVTVLRGDYGMVHPHAVWFSWASPRNRLECAIRILVDLKETGLVLISVPQEKASLFKHLCKYGVLRQVGVIRYYGQMPDLAVFQGVHA